jgi:hypothetical protein
MSKIRGVCCNEHFNQILAAVYTSCRIGVLSYQADYKYSVDGAVVLPFFTESSG